MEKIKLTGTSGIILKGATPEPDKDYIVAIRCALDATTRTSDGEDTTYIMKYEATEAIEEWGTRKKLKVQQGKTKSQILRHLICSVGRQEGEDVDEYYDKEMDKIIQEWDNKLCDQ